MDSERRADQTAGPSLSDEVFGKGTLHSGRFGFQMHQLPPREVQSASEQLRQQLRLTRRRRRWQLSAVATVLLIMGALAYRPLYRSLTTVSYVTHYGETQQITLPDGSTVTLNANSRLQRPRRWSEERPREVWLQGEAYFSVVKSGTLGSRRFVVHTDGLAIEVVGTTFNVNQRQQVTRVVLTSGEVKLFRDGATHAEAVMQPGDLVVFSPQTQQLTQQVTEPRLHTAWKENLLVFEDESLQQIGRTLNDRYGIILRFGTPNIAQQRFTATLPADRIEVFFTLLSSSFTIQRTLSTVTVYEKSPQ
jgi:ferric-dicitrate binding protein FerR (iron transport regulator)